MADHLKLVSGNPTATRPPASDQTVVVWRRSQDVACVTVFAGDRVEDTQCFTDLGLALMFGTETAGTLQCPLETTFNLSRPHTRPSRKLPDDVPF